LTDEGIGSDPSDQKGLSRGILDSADGQWYASQPIVTDRGEVRAMLRGTGYVLPAFKWLGFLPVLGMERPSPPASSDA